MSHSTEVDYEAMRVSLTVEGATDVLTEEEAKELGEAFCEVEGGKEIGLSLRHLSMCLRETRERRLLPDKRRKSRKAVLPTTAGMFEEEEG